MFLFPKELTSVRAEADKYIELKEKERENVEKAEANYESVQAGTVTDLSKITQELGIA